MDNFDEYLVQGEPNKSEKAKAWKIAIGLQQVDGLTPSEYLIASAKQNIEGEISLEDVKQRIDNYYQQQPLKSVENRTEEADKVSVQIAELLNEKTFSFSSLEYLTIHKRLFQGIYNHAGIIRDYNITKAEWVLNGETVLYANAENLKETLQYDLLQEKKFNFKGLSISEIIEHLAYFTSDLWQIHPFGEGNTRTTAIFLIKYLRQLGFKEVNNDLFANHSLYFRNALVRANYENITNGIYKSKDYLIYFLSNLLLNESHSLKNRELHIHFSDTVKSEFDTVNDTVFSLIEKNKQITTKEISEKLGVSLSTVKRKINTLKKSGLLDRIGSDKTGYWRILN
jgi:fido (protein-threonine AMPylation protein)/biotin operon repressor